ncbi:MAG: DEAD/DEAH box helicase [Bacteroidetes bacterium]|nr:DEAD/DEAH box helicase [Bacteroidota bacterium]
MGELEFIIALTEHRFLGTIFQPLLIQKKERFYSVTQFVKTRDLDNSDYHFKPFERELVKIIEKYSDEVLMKKFTRAKSVSDFYSTLKPLILEKQIKPFIEQCLNQSASILMLSPVRLFKKDAKYSNLYEEDILKVAPLFGRPEFYFERTETHTQYQLKIFLKDKEINLQGRNVKLVTGDSCMLLYKSQLVIFEKLNSKKLVPFFEKDFVVVPNTIEEKYYAGFILNTVRDYEVKAQGFVVENTNVEKKAILSLEKNLKLDPCLVLQFEYGNERFLPNSERKIAVTLQKENGTFKFSKTVRDVEWENKVILHINEIGLTEKNGYFAINGMQLLEQKNALYFFVNWLNENRPLLAKKEIAIVQEKLNKKFYTGSQSLEIQTQTKGDWFDVYAVVHFGEFSIPFIKLKKFILNGIREFELPNGEIAVLPEEWFAQYGGMLPFGKQEGDSLQFEKYHFPLLQNIIQKKDTSIFEKYEKLLNSDKNVVTLPTNTKAKLRNYQEDGFNWMHSLYENKFGGCLADDMGLGKTLQALTLLLKLKRLKRDITISDPLSDSNQFDLFEKDSIPKEEIQPASLIVLPTSLVHNWDNEIKKFTPGLKAYKYVGAQRKKAVDIEKISQFYDVILTTYGTVRNDSKLLSQTEFYYLILDESQFIKNSTSKTYKAVMKLQAKHRLVITGTPIENSLSDLWSQMNFLNQGILGNLASFKRLFITPIEKYANQEQQEKLQLMIRPFILRRKKNDVAKDLPPLVEQVQYCSMAKEQEKMYEEEKSVIRNAILSSIEKEGVGKSSIAVLQGLTKLRQLANHPSLLEKDAEEGSGKFDEIFRMLQNLVAEKHKVLIFSSFVTHLELLKDRIEQEGWKYSMLTGKTTKRESVIKEFQEEAENHIFLISLKAGGVGLNLTEADYVFILDPWWNPASENQAINRAHRIGQNKNVFVYRFITENSIEEKIQKLKERKSSLADQFINSNNPLEKVTREEIVELFR